MYNKYNFEVNKARCVAIASLLLNIFLMFHINGLNNEYNDNLNLLAKKIDALYNENEILEKDNKTYTADKDYLESIGATKEQALITIKAANLHHVDPRLLGALIKSESDFVNKNHDLKHVIGIAGINIACGSILPYDVYSDDGNIMNAAKLLQDYKIIYKTDLKAIARYKGYSKEGFKQARNVINIYNNTL